MHKGRTPRVLFYGLLITFYLQQETICMYHMCLLPFINKRRNERELSKARKELVQNPSILLKACKENNLKKIKLLIDAGASVDISDSQKITPLHVIAMRNNTEAAKLVIEAGAYLNVQDETKNTPLIYAVVTAHDSIDLVEYLLKSSADVSAQNNAGKTALHYAVIKDNTEHPRDVEITKLLLKYHFPVDTQDANGNTALHLAVFFGRSTIARLLLEHNASIWITNKRNRTPLHIEISKSKTTPSCIWPLLSESFFSPVCPFIATKDKTLSLKKMTLIALIKHWHLYKSDKEFDKYIDIIEESIEAENFYLAITERSLEEQRLLFQLNPVPFFRDHFLEAHGQRHLKGLKYLLSMVDKEGTSLRRRSFERRHSSAQFLNILYKAQNFNNLHPELQEAIKRSIGMKLTSK